MAIDEKAVFVAALALADANEREAYLQEACASHPELLARLRELLSAHEESQGPLDRGPVALGATADTAYTERPGTVIGPYKLLQQIGEGGMGTVYMAEQTQPVQRKVALKVIKAGMDSRQVIARFEAERQALAMMDHVNIARVFDGGATDAGRPYFVMELVHGVPITKYCDDNHLTPRERLELFVPVCQAIQHAHQKGIIHRDIKPSNVMVTLYDGKPVPKVIDFGVAKATEQKLTERTLFTQYGAMVGTLEYMSPEQAEMSALGVDTRSDIYSLGVLLYELLTGNTPLTHLRMKEVAYAEILRMIKEEEPPKPSTRLSDSGEALASISAQRHTEPAKLTKLVKGELDWIVMKTLEKDRSRRYETASGLARDVERYLKDEQVQAYPPSSWYRFRKFARRNKGPVLAASLIVLALVIGSIVSTWQAVRATRAGAEADRQRARAQVNFGKARAAVDRMLSRVGEKRLAIVPQMEEERQRLLEDALEFYREFLQEDSSDPEVRQETAKAYQRIAQIYQLLGKKDLAEQANQQALVIQQLLAEQFPAEAAYRYDQAVSHQGLGELFRASGQTAQAETAYRKALDLLQSVTEAHPDVPDYERGLAAAHHGLGQLWQDTSRLEAADGAFNRALAIRGQLASRHPEVADYQSDLAKSHNSLGLLYRSQGQKPQALKSVEAALAIWEQLARTHRQVPEYQNELARTYESCGALHREAGQATQAEAVLQAALKLRTQLVRDHPKVLEYQNDQARTYYQLGELHTWISARSADRQKQATAALQEALKIQERLSRDHPRELVFAVGLAMTCAEMGVVLREAGDAEAALPWYARNLSILEGVLRTEPQHTEARQMLSSTHMVLAETLVRLGRRPEAIKSWQRMADLGAGQSQSELRALRCLGLAQLGDHVRATAEVKAMEATGKEPVYSLYNFVCAFSLSVRAARNDASLSPAERTRYADEYGAYAVALLTKMRSAGFFKNSGALEYLKKDTDMEPLRERADFQKLLQELERDAPTTAK